MTLMRAPSWKGFLLAMLAGALCLWVALAAWVSAAPLTILNTGQASLIAKDDLLKQFLRFRRVLLNQLRLDPLSSLHHQ